MTTNRAVYCWGGSGIQVRNYTNAARRLVRETLIINCLGTYGVKSVALHG